jgi:hypothetical protein
MINDTLNNRTVSTRHKPACITIEVYGQGGLKVSPYGMLEVQKVFGSFPKLFGYKGVPPYQGRNHG